MVALAFRIPVVSKSNIINIFCFLFFNVVLIALFKYTPLAN